MLTLANSHCQLISTYNSSLNSRRRHQHTQPGTFKSFQKSVYLHVCVVVPVSSWKARADGCCWAQWKRGEGKHFNMAASTTSLPAALRECGLLRNSMAVSQKSCQLLPYLDIILGGFVGVKSFGNVTQKPVSCPCRQHVMPIYAVKAGSIGFETWPEFRMLSDCNY